VSSTGICGGPPDAARARRLARGGGEGSRKERPMPVLAALNLGIVGTIILVIVVIAVILWFLRRA
jgi:hypothetical protein